MAKWCVSDAHPDCFKRTGSSNLELTIPKGKNNNGSPIPKDPIRVRSERLRVVHLVAKDRFIANGIGSVLQMKEVRRRNEMLCVHERFKQDHFLLLHPKSSFRHSHRTTWMRCSSIATRRWCTGYLLERDPKQDTVCSVSERSGKPTPGKYDRISCQIERPTFESHAHVVIRVDVTRKADTRQWCALFGIGNEPVDRHNAAGPSQQTLDDVCVND